MPSHGRVVVPGAPHHIYLRANNRRSLFSSDGERLCFLGCLERGLGVSGCKVHQLTLMGNHIHMIVSPPEPQSLARLFQRTNQRYAQVRNKRRNATGKLFEERYHSKVIRDEAQLMTTTLYNDANWYSAGKIDDPCAHVWSTGPLHAGRAGSRIPMELWTPSPWYLGLGETVEARGAAYRACMESYLAQEREALVDEETERRDIEPYDLRIKRPDGSSAREASGRWGRKR
jgi:putative transposase